MRFIVWLGLVCVFVQVAGAQVYSPIFLNNERFSLATLQRNTVPTTWPQNNCSTDGRCYAIIQFDHILTDEEKAQLTEFGLLLHDYIPHYAYLASYNGGAEMPFSAIVTQVVALEPRHKRPLGPLASSEASESEEPYKLVGIPFPGISLLALAQNIENRGAQIIGITEKWVHYEVSTDLLPDILASPAMQYTEAAPVTPFTEGDQGRSSSRLPRIDLSNGLGYTGDGIGIAIGDDGAVRHLDLHGRLVDHTQYDSGSHAEMTSGMAVGAGNIDPTTMGSAPGASIHLFDIATNNHIDLAPAHFDNYGIAITSTSFGEGCGEVYELSTSEIDQQVFDHPQLAHVFSAGNHGTDPCFNAYSWLGATSNGNYYATITGGRKAGKNVIAVGNVEWNDQLLASSSRGPTPDGRIKPDLSALGQFDRTIGPENTYRFSSGTSAAAPNVAGALSVLYEQYLETHAGQYPSSALIKAMVLNTADDMGPTGPDYNYGWGRLNTRKALEALSNNQYFSATVGNGQQQQFNVSVPAGAHNLRVMLYWHDPAGSVLSSRALVNDLDLRVITGNGQAVSPWVPSSVPNLDSLQRAALPGEDHINNVEQVFIPEPALGTYQVQINGFQVPEGPQTFFVVYSYDVSEMELLSPQMGATYLPGEVALLTWDAIASAATFTLEYSANGGASWFNIATNIPSTARSFQWEVPNITTDQLMIRLRRAGALSVSGQMGVVTPEVAFTTTYQSQGIARLEWEAIPGAVTYQVYALGDRYMEEIGTTANNYYDMPAVVEEGYWLSVAPVLASGRAGRRAISQYYEHFGCESNVRLAFQFDAHPSETVWYILGADGSIRASGGQYSQLAPFSYHEEVICLPPGCFTLAITDTNDNGMCCAHGEGFYQLWDADGNLLASESSFGSISYNVFCVEPNVNSSLAVATTVLNDISCAGNSDGVVQATATGGTGNYNFIWSNGATGPTLGSLPSGNYQVTVTDGEQEVVGTVSLIAPSSMQVTSTSTPSSSCNNGSISLNISGGTPPYHINWADGNDNDAFFRTNLAAGQYFALVVDANGCQQTHSRTVTEVNPIVLNSSVIMPSCTNPIGGRIAVSAQGGSGNYQYQWSTGATGTSILTNLVAGSYTVTVTSGGCSTMETINLVNPTSLEVSEISASPRCSDSQDGWISLTVSGGSPPYNYEWLDGNTQSYRGGLQGGMYIVTITDAVGCSALRGFSLTSPPELRLNTEVVHAAVGQNGSIVLSIQGGTPPYLVQWDNGMEATVLENLGPGQYAVTVTDANGCSISTLVTVDDETGIEQGQELVYCDVQGVSTSFEWIESININGNDYISGNNAGQGNYTDVVIPMAVGELQQVELVPGYQSTAYNEYWKVWIDYNRDGDFMDSNEEVVALGPLIGNTQFNFVPPPGLTGSTRLRIAMSHGTQPMLCDNISYGEVEDYTIEWISPNGGATETQGLWGVPSGGSTIDSAMPWQVFPNPVSSIAQVRAWSPNNVAADLRVLSQDGRMMLQSTVHLEKGQNELLLDLTSLPPGLYQVVVLTGQWKEHMRIIKL